MTLDRLPIPAGAAVLAGLVCWFAWGGALAQEPVVVQDCPGYNSWPMTQAIGSKLVCAYSRGKKHTIGDGERGVFARTSTDGGKTWTPETPVAVSPEYGEVTIGKGLDADGAMLLWIRCFGGPRPHHDLYRTADGITFALVATPALSPLPMQITDVFHVPTVGLMALWFAGTYQNTPSGSWGTLTSADNGRTWRQRTVEDKLMRTDWPTEPSAVYLDSGKILVIARTEGGPAQFQITSCDYGRTWKRARTNIRDVMASTPSLILDRKTGLLSNYYYERGQRKVRRRAARPDDVFDSPTAWPESEVLAFGNEKVPWDAGNANATVIGDTHYVSYYSGNAPETTVYVLPVTAPAK